MEEAAAELALAKLEDPTLQTQMLEALETNLRREMRHGPRSTQPAGAWHPDWNGGTWGDYVLGRCWHAAGLLGFPGPGPYTWRQLSRLAAGRYEPFAVLAHIWGGGKTSTVDDFNPYVINKQKLAAPRGKKVTFAQIMPLLKQWVPEEKR